MRVKFTKRRFYKGKLQEPGNVVKMSSRDARAYINNRAAVFCPREPEPAPVVTPEPELEPKAEEPRLEDMSYPELQTLAREKELPSGGKKEELIARLEAEQEEDD